MSSNSLKAWVFGISSLTGSAFGLKELITKNNPLPPPTNRHTSSFHWFS
ncbi:hypothetical protein [Mycoplasma wenyonii]|nr:hypothetical protein [Mycoplasma wenyonii]